MIFIDLNTQNILVPWIYLFYNDDFNQVWLKMMVTDLESHA
jgi:hypothetical protein